MKRKSLITTLWLLIVLATTAHISYGQSSQDTTNQFSIKQSLKCFQEQKGLKIIIENKDSIIMADRFYHAFTKAYLESEVKRQANENRELKVKNETLKGKNYLLITTLVIETIILGIAVIF